jgi:MFS family permease
VIPPVLREPGFRLYWLGIVLTNLGTRATVAANLWQVLQLTNSTLQVGLVGLAEAIALLVMAPLGGALADRLDRRRLIQVTQAVSLVAALALSLATFTGAIQAWHIYLAVVVIGAAQTFDGPARQALIPALVSQERLVDAFALVNPTRELAILVGPAVAGILIASVGAGAVYAFDAVTYAVLIVMLAMLHVPRVLAAPKTQSIWASIGEGFAYVRQRKLIWQLMSLDFVATFCIGYRVLLPTLARDVLGVGAAGYGILAAAPAAGAIIGSAVIYRLRAVSAKGAMILGATVGYALAAILLGLAPTFGVAIVAAGALGVFDAITTTLRHAVVQLDTPDHLRGRVTSAYQMVSRGGPSLGQVQMGALATALGAPLALGVGASATLLYTLWLGLTGTTVRGYTGAEIEPST